MDEWIALATAAGELKREHLEELIVLVEWLATQPETEEDACIAAIDSFAAERGVRLPGSP